MPRKLRFFHYNPWADKVEDAAEYVKNLPSYDLSKRVANPRDPKLMRLGELDCHWHGESTRCFASLSHPDFEFLPARVFAKEGYSQLLSLVPPPDEEWWLIFYGQHPQAMEKLAGKLFAALRQRGFKIFFYSFDEASRAMPCFKEIAPSLSVLIHDEAPLDPAGKALLSNKCVIWHRSWVANILPFSSPFVEEPEHKIIFLGSEMGFTPHRRRQVEYLQKRFKDRFIGIHDHSVAVNERNSLSKYKVSLCPEGRKFSTPGMSACHTDRPFWSGCLGMVPVSENSKQGGRLEELHQAGLILRYPHGDLNALGVTCERALALEHRERRRLYDYFNQHETVGTVVVEALVKEKLGARS